MPNEKVKHYLITNRRVYQRGEKEYINESGNEFAGHNLRFGELYFDPGQRITDVTGDHYHLYPDPPAEEMPPQDLADANTGFTYEHVSHYQFGSTVLFEALNRNGAEAHDDPRHILVYIHGYKCDLKTAFESVRNLHNLYVANPESPVDTIVLFTWPAKEKLLEYRDDAQDAINSGYALARTLKKLQRFFRQIALQMRNREESPFCHQKIHLMCHSMGNRVLEAMFEELNKTQTKVNSIFGEILLIAADVDYDAFDAPKPLYNLIEMGERIHIYYHRHDRALGISETTKNAFNRLGRWGAKNTTNLPDDCVQVDVSSVKEDNASFFENMVNHWYYLYSNVVIQDIIEVLKGKASKVVL